MLTSPDYPNNYPDNLLYTLLIIASEDMRVKISVIALDLEPEEICGYDYLQVNATKLPYSISSEDKSLLLENIYFSFQ